MNGCLMRMGDAGSLFISNSSNQKFVNISYKSYIEHLEKDRDQQKKRS